LTTCAVRTVGLTRAFGKQTAVDGVDLAVPHGAVYGFLGPNGSGKTTTIRMLLGLLAADAGQIEVLGESMPRAANRVLPRVGALIEGPAFHPYISVNRTCVVWMSATRRQIRQPRPSESATRWPGWV
jgi:ABC-2 type transport system ATP-binding protein